MSDCERQCYVIGGPWLAEDPDCPVHGTDAVRARREAHALRSTFVSLALEDGADPRLIERMTHTPGKTRSAFARYDRADYWPQLCAEVARIQIAPRTGGRIVGTGAWDATRRNQSAGGDQ